MSGSGCTNLYDAPILCILWHLRLSRDDPTAQQRSQEEREKLFLHGRYRLVVLQLK